MYGTLINANARTANFYSAILSPTRSFEPTGKRGEYFMEAENEVQALRDGNFIANQGAEVIAIVGI